MDGMDAQQHSEQFVQDAGPMKKGPWTAEEDAILVASVSRHGVGNWNSVQKISGLSRCGKSCRLRWANHLRPNLRTGAFTPEEERKIMELHSTMRNRWARMAAQLPGRTDNEIKNYWNARVKRRRRAGLPIYPLGLPIYPLGVKPTTASGDNQQSQEGMGPEPESEGDMVSSLQDLQIVLSKL